MLRHIERSDWVKDFEQANSQEIEAELMSTMRPMNRPGTASKEEPKTGVGEDGRPMTSAIIGPKPQKPQIRSAGVTGQRLQLCIMSTWGDKHYVGLTGLEFLGPGGRPLSIKAQWIDAQPRDMNCIPGYSGDYRTLDKLIDSMNRTMDDHHMWLVPFTPGQQHSIWVDFQAPIALTGIRFWNYNKSPDDTSRGVRSLALFFDGQPLASFTLRKAPGSQAFGFAQLFILPFSDPLSEELKAPFYQRPKFPSELTRQMYEVPCLPVGYIFKLRLLSTWGDNFYIGLNGVELFDHQGRRLLATPCFTLTASPSSVQELPGHERDMRTVEKLVDGVNNTYDDRHMWLAPFANSEQIYAAAGPRVNEVTLTFEKQVCLSYVLLWNYGKTQSRGTREYELLLDDLLLYHGVLKPAPPQGSGDFACAVLFTGDRSIVESVKHLVYIPPREQTNVLMYNERKLVSGSQDARKPELARPSTSVVGK